MENFSKENRNSLKKYKFISEHISSSQHIYHNRCKCSWRSNFGWHFYGPASSLHRSSSQPAKSSCPADETWRQGEELSKSTKSHKNHEVNKKMFNCFSIDDRTTKLFKEKLLLMLHALAWFCMLLPGPKKEATKQRNSKKNKMLTLPTNTGLIGRSHAK